jgi:hypothetical protein
MKTTMIDLCLLGGSVVLLLVVCWGLVNHASVKFLQTAGLLCLAAIIVIGVIQLLNSFHGPKGT